MFAVGGQDGVSCLNFVERYDPQLNKWTKVASMSTRRLGVGVAVLGGYLYAVGGSDGTSPLNTGSVVFLVHVFFKIAFFSESRKCH